MGGDVIYLTIEVIQLRSNHFHQVEFLFLTTPDTHEQAVHLGRISERADPITPPCLVSEALILSQRDLPPNQPALTVSSFVPVHVSSHLAVR